MPAVKKKKTKKKHPITQSVLHNQYAGIRARGRTCPFGGYESDAASCVARTFVQDGVCRPGNDHWMDSPTDFTTPTVRDRDSEFRFLQFIKHQGPCQVRSEKK
jgi:hypothetical protein